MNLRIMDRKGSIAIPPEEEEIKPIGRNVAINQEFLLFDEPNSRFTGSGLRSRLTLSIEKGIELPVEIFTLPIVDERFKEYRKLYLPFTSTPMKVISQDFADPDASTILAVIRASGNVLERYEDVIQRELRKLRLTLESARDPKFLEDAQRAIGSDGNDGGVELQNFVASLRQTFGYFAKPALDLNKLAEAEFRGFVPIEAIPEEEEGIFKIPNNTAYFSQISGRFTSTSSLF